MRSRWSSLRSHHSRVGLFSLAVAASACRAPAGSPTSVGTAAGPAPAVPAAPAPERAAQSAGVDLTAIDRSVAPCADFYQFACGAWMQRTPIPPDRPAWTRSFSEINDRNLEILHAILDDYAAGKVPNDEPDAKKVGDFYAACMNEAAVDSAGDAALAALAGRIANIKTLGDLAAEVRWLSDRGFDVLFGFGADQDFKDATQVIGQADQGGLGLPDRDYYLKSDPKSQEIRANYKKHVARMFTLAGDAPEAAEKHAAVVLAIETELARASMSRVDRRDPRKIYHRIDRAGLESAAPAFAWKRYFVDALEPVRAINVLVPDFFTRMSALLTQTPLASLRTYLRWHTLHDHAGALPRRFVDEDFAFSSANLTGSQQLLPRWKRCESSVEGALGEALAQPFVKRTFGAAGKAAALAMIGDIETSFEANLGTLDWMDAKTRAAALEKAKRVFNKIGYPDQWRRYDAVAVARERHLDNVLAADAFEAQRQYRKIGKPVDRGEWAMTPPTVNAYYNAQLNEMVFPAGILQPPFFASTASVAANYGGIGMVMGHELTHGFDDEGRQFDGAGNLREWWTPAVSSAYQKKAACVVAQYDRAVAVDDVHVNGKLTLGENIADMGGIKLALAALARRAPAGAGSGTGGFTPAQELFVSFAQGWCTNRRAAYARMLAGVDPHSPPRERVNAPLRNLPAFAEAFSCPAGAPMAPAERCAVW